MILELDCGNTLIKWRKLAASGRIESVGLVHDLAELAEKLDCSGLSQARLCSVRSCDETAELVDWLAGQGLKVHLAQPSAVLGSVRNGYHEPERLGLDRWLAVVGAYQLAQGAALVLDLGTAITADYVAADGRHLGGFICPGLPLLRHQLKTHTRKIRYNDDQAREALTGDGPGASTAEAVERGCLEMVRAFARAQIAQAQQLLGDCPVFITGGDARLLEADLPTAHYVADLVFVGLALACPLKD